VSTLDELGRIDRRHVDRRFRGGCVEVADVELHD
jgi:hypothetical protein